MSEKDTIMQALATVLGEASHRSLFREGDLALLIDRKNRRYLLTLKSDGVFHTHLGYLKHSNIIGQPQGSWHQTTNGHRLLALKPTLSDYILQMERVTQVIYPKDVGAILMLADIFPGARVVEAGFGSGALTLALLRSTGPAGHVTSYELREGQAAKALNNIRPLLPSDAPLTLKDGDIYQGFDERDIDRLVLDVPEPWHVVPHALHNLTPGGIFLAFLPTTIQVHRLVEAISAHPEFQLVETIEVMLRPWHVSHNSMRPTHRMVGHTGFITTARKCHPRPGGAQPIQQQEV
ncbi:MAG: tRNA (adenine-N1)-methyltransferase [SAR202 cluster bacterium]|nr:tRNA (adenine-N1)-methyltransferase [SAR202 cluster bacterium]